MMSLPALAASLYGQAKYAAILIDNDTGEVLYARQADTLRAPASITKVMTLYVAFEDMAAGRLREDDRITVSKHAARQDPSKIWLRPGSSISVRDAIGTIATRSANDAAVALAEHIAGSEDAFAERMSATARRLGMTQTRFVNASGLSDSRHLTTARDIAVLSRAMIRDFPVLYPVFSQTSYAYRGQAIANHNHLLKTMAGVDGIKTGFTQTAGFTLAASAVQNGKRLIAVVLGGPSRMGRDSNVGELLSIGFDVLNRRRLGIETTVAANFAEPDDLSDSVMDRLATILAPDAAVVLAGTPLPPLQPGGQAGSGAVMGLGTAMAAANAMSNSALLTYPPR
ncbi:D-alanyl-D-alanine carboxypeptidase family protein [Sandarakinorhabdus sp.]|uniref:D-alanyl-D-alanine carboxypeptidase family protein n=1 Tax=Sandarakinorhabdus sp. TaxID=1916663 RepID=UPI00286DBBED|nr:D-alanyl-D-alanine carboxypeptidase family protein [Sandarakinorhabdus sp.]